MMKVTNPVIEVEFEDVSVHEAVRLLYNVITQSQLRNYVVASDISEIDIQSQERILDAVVCCSDGMFAFNFTVARFNHLEINNLSVFVYKYDSRYSLSITAPGTDFRSAVSLQELQKISSTLSNELNARKYYCGLEPAKDSDLRFFTGSDIGPLHEW